MSRVDIEELPIPDAVGGAGWDDFAATIDAASATEVAGYGTTDTVATAEERLPHWHDPEDEFRLLGARVDGRIVGRAAISRSRQAPETAWLDLQVHPDAQGHGVGGALHAAVLPFAGDLGIRKLIVYAVSPDAPGERVEAPTGFGSVPRGNREVRFLLERGWRLEQVERASRFPLPADPEALAALRAGAEAHASGYRVHIWPGVTPAEHRAGMAELLRRMTTDAPTAGLEEPEEAWSAERVLEHETRLDGHPMRLLTAAAEHTASGRLAGMTRFAVPRGPRAVQQWDTIVRREDRGHRLGMLLKVANLQALAERHPGHPSVVTWNAEENRHMLSVNEAVGFVAIGYDGAWRKDL